MDQKSWLWKKRSTEKTLVADKGNNPLAKNEEVSEIQKLQTEKAELERDLRTLDGKLSSAISECNAKDNIAKKQVKIAEEAIAGWEKAEMQANSLKQELEKVLQQKAASEERVDHLDAALKECMQQLRFLREDQEKRVHGVVLKTSEAFEKVRINLDEKLAEAGRRLAKLDAENIQLIKALSGKDKVIEDLSNYRTRLEADFHALMSRVEASEKENTSLKYEVCVLEKELVIRNEEREFNCRTAELAQKQHLESAKKIGRLEMECQRLRLLVRKRLPGPATLAKMRSEVEVLGKDQVELRRMKSNPYSPSSMESCSEVGSEQPSKRIDVLLQQLHRLEEENRTLKVALSTSSESHFSGVMYATCASSPSQAELQVEKSLKGHDIAEPAKHLRFLQEHTLMSSSDVGSDDKVSCAESWASALISELEHFKNEKQLGTSSYRSIGTSEISLMDDFAEMEKMAVISVDYPSGSSHYSSEKVNGIVSTALKPSDLHSSNAPGMELSPVRDCTSEPSILSQEIPSEDLPVNKVPQSPSDILKMLLDHCRVSQRSPHGVLEDMKFALANNAQDIDMFLGNRRSTDHPDASCNGSEHVIPTSPRKSMNLDVSETVDGNDNKHAKKSTQELPPTVSISIHKILELLEGLNMHSQHNRPVESFSGKDDNQLLYKNSENTAGFMVRVFQWKTTELSSVLQQLVSTCTDLLNGMANLEQFAEQMASNLEWVINHCFSIQDVSSMKDAIRNHFDWDESMSDGDGDAECGSVVPSLSSNYSYSHKEELQPPKGESWNADQADNESPLADSKWKLQSEITKGESLRIQLQESTDMINCLQSQMETMKHAGGQSGHQTEKQNMMKDGLEARLMEITKELKNASQKIACLEDELENKNNLCQRLEERCLELNSKLESRTNKEIPDNGKPWEKELENDWEITAASEKLAECQETILNLGKQLKALASPSDAALFDKVVHNPANTVGTSVSARRSTSQRSSLLDKMIAEDEEKLSASNTSKADIQNTTESSDTSTATINGINHHKDKSETAVASMDIVPRKKKGSWTIFRKIFRRRKKGNNSNNNKTPSY